MSIIELYTRRVFGTSNPANLFYDIVGGELHGDELVQALSVYKDYLDENSEPLGEYLNFIHRVSAEEHYLPLFFNGLRHTGYMLPAINEELDAYDEFRDMIGRYVYFAPIPFTEEHIAFDANSINKVFGTGPLEELMEEVGVDGRTEEQIWLDEWISPNELVTWNDTMFGVWSEPDGDTSWFNDYFEALPYADYNDEEVNEATGIFATIEGPTARNIKIYGVFDTPEEALRAIFEAWN